MNKELTTRLITAIIGIPLILFVFYTGGILLLALLGIVSVIGMWEYARILYSKEPFKILGVVCITLSVFSLTVFYNQGDPTFYFALFIMIFLVLAGLLVIIFLDKSKLGGISFVTTAPGWIYTGVFPGLIYRLGASYKEEKSLLILIVLIWITDSAAYFIGMRFGKNRGIFKVSPQKSLEGFVAGLIAPILFCFVLYVFLPLLNLKHLLLIALCAGFIGQMGDLLESKIKRIGGVKDSGFIIPGHGGVLDRFDSLLLAGPVLYILLKTLT